jgi:cytochrome c-type biogenesis protein CcmF
VLNNLLLTTGAATVLLGTLYPLFLDAVGGPKLSVGFPFFDRTFVPLMVPLLLAVGVGPLLAWKRGDLLGALQRLWIAFAAAICVIFVGIVINSGGHVLAWLGLGLATWTFAATGIELAERLRLFRIPLGESVRRAFNLPRSAYGMTFAHMGLAVSVAGISASAFVAEHLDVVKIGGELPIAGYVLHLDAVNRVPGPNFTADAADIRITKGSETIAVVHPERRFFTLQQQTTSETAIRTNFLADLYIALGDPDNANGWTIRAYYKPLVPWIWIGAIIMAFGGMVSLSDRRWRVGIAYRARARSQAAQPAAGD